MNSKSTRVLLPILILTLALVGLLSGSSIIAAQDVDSDVTFATPEEAITFYIQALAEGDIDKLMQVSAADEMSENFSFDLFIGRVQALFPNAAAPSTDYPLYLEMNRAQFTWELLFQTRNLAYGLLVTDPESLNQTVRMDAEGAAAFRQEVDPAQLAPLEVAQIGIPEPELVQTERLQTNWDAQAQMFGADEFTERVALLEFEGNYYLAGFVLLRYGDNWKIRGLGSALGGVNAFGAPEQTTPSNFQTLIEE